MTSIIQSIHLSCINSVVSLTQGRPLIFSPWNSLRVASCGIMPSLIDSELVAYCCVQILHALGLIR